MHEPSADALLHRLRTGDPREASSVRLVLAKG